MAIDETAAIEARAAELGALSVADILRADHEATERGKAWVAAAPPHERARCERAVSALPSPRSIHIVNALEGADGKGALAREVAEREAVIARAMRLIRLSTGDS